MTFDAQAYAEGICNTAAGSSIELFVATIDDALRTLSVNVSPLGGDDTTASRLLALRNAIVERERETGEETTFEEPPETTFEEPPVPETVVQVGDFRVRVAVVRRADGEHCITLAGVGCDLEGDEPGVYTPVASA